MNRNVHLILTDPPAFPADLMQGPDHVTYPATSEYTRMLIEAMDSE